MASRFTLDFFQLQKGIHLAIWSLLMVTLTLFFALYMPLSASLLRAGVNILALALLFYLNLYLVNHYLEKGKYRFFIFAIVFLLLLGTLIRGYANTRFPATSDLAKEMIQNSSWYYSAFLTNLIILLIGTFYQLMYNRFLNEKQNLTIISEQREAQLQALRGQINPHFLFNTLNNIYALATIKSDKTADMVLKLSTLLRYVIYKSQEEQVLLSDEINHIQQYIDLFQMRNESPVRIGFRQKDIQPGIRLEPMILIPLVENCFKHCDFEHNPKAYVQLDLEIDQDLLTFRTINTYDPADQQKDKVGGVGLDNIQKRLALKYDTAQHLTIHQNGNLFQAELKIPVHHEAH